MPCGGGPWPPEAPPPPLLLPPPHPPTVTPPTIPHDRPITPAGSPPTAAREQPATQEAMEAASQAAKAETPSSRGAHGEAVPWEAAWDFGAVTSIHRGSSSTSNRSSPTPDELPSKSEAAAQRRFPPVLPRLPGTRPLTPQFFGVPAAVPISPPSPAGKLASHARSEAVAVDDDSDDDDLDFRSPGAKALREQARLQAAARERARTRDALNATHVAERLERARARRPSGVEEQEIEESRRSRSTSRDLARSEVASEEDARGGASKIRRQRSWGRLQVRGMRV